LLYFRYVSLDVSRYCGKFAMIAANSISFVLTLLLFGLKLKNDYSGSTPNFGVNLWNFGKDSPFPENKFVNAQLYI